MNAEQLQQLPVEQLDQMAFGRVQGVQRLPIDEIQIRYQDDYENALDFVEGCPDCYEDALDEPVDVALERGVYWLQDGHHRFVTAQARGDRDILVDLQIKDNPVKALMERQAMRRLPKQIFDHASNLISAIDERFSRSRTAKSVKREGRRSISFEWTGPCVDSTLRGVHRAFNLLAKKEGYDPVPAGVQTAGMYRQPVVTYTVSWDEQPVATLTLKVFGRVRNETLMTIESESLQPVDTTRQARLLEPKYRVDDSHDIIGEIARQLHSRYGRDVEVPTRPAWVPTNELWDEFVQFDAHPEDPEVEQMELAISAGQRLPPIVTYDGTIESGHAAIEAAHNLGIESVPIIEAF